MARLVMVFTLSDRAVRDHLLDEFTRHDDVVATSDDSGGGIRLRVDVLDTPATMWDARVTVGVYDEMATLVEELVQPE